MSIFNFFRVFFNIILNFVAPDCSSNETINQYHLKTFAQPFYMILTQSEINLTNLLCIPLSKSVD